MPKTTKPIIATADLCDRFEKDIHDGLIHVLPPIFQKFGLKVDFFGQAVTVKTFEDNMLIKKILETESGKNDGYGKIVVIDGGASLRCALVGGNIALAGQKNGWQGIIVNGCIRDSEEINAIDIGVRAIKTNPLRSFKKNIGERDLPININGVYIETGDWVYVDADGIVVSKEALH